MSALVTFLPDPVISSSGQFWSSFPQSRIGSVRSTDPSGIRRAGSGTLPIKHRPGLLADSLDPVPSQTAYRTWLAGLPGTPLASQAARDPGSQGPSQPPQGPSWDPPARDLPGTLQPASQPGDRPLSVYSSSQPARRVPGGTQVHTPYPPTQVPTPVPHPVPTLYPPRTHPYPPCSSPACTETAENCQWATGGSQGGQEARGP